MGNERKKAQLSSRKNVKQKMSSSLGSGQKVHMEEEKCEEVDWFRVELVGWLCSSSIGQAVIFS